MNKKFAIALVAMFTFAAFSGVVLAQEEEHAATTSGPDTQNWLYISAAFGMAMVSSFCAIAMGIAIKSFSEGVARNPSAGDKLQFGLILTLVLIETLALYVLAIIFLKVA